MFKRVSDRICTGTIIYKNRNIIVISVYAPTLEKCEKDTNIREEFYDQLEKTISDVPNRDVLFIAGDLNAKTGSEYRNFKNYMGEIW